MSSMIYSRLWGKWDELPSSYPLACHLLDTAAIAVALWDTYLTDGERRVIAAAFGVEVDAVRGMVAFWAGLHDLGKCCPSFQGQMSGPRPDFLSEKEFESAPGWMHEEPVRHERVTHLVVPSLLAAYGYDVASRPGRSVAHQVAQILGGHHGVYGPMLDRATMADPGRAEPRIGVATGWMEQRSALVDVVHEACGRPAAPTKTAPGGVAVMVTGLVVLADWLASHADWVRRRLGEWRASGGSDWFAHHTRAVKAAPRGGGPGATGAARVAGRDFLRGGVP
ncbi:hypothetical protein GCM10020000_84630 [Streptomyces olivoverticillatus]